MLESPRAATPAAALRNILRRELGAGWRGALAWWLPATALLTMTLSLQPEMAKEGSLFAQKLEMLPKGMLVAFGISATNLGDPVFYTATNFSIYALLGATFAGLLGAAALSREEAYGTSELLYALPVARHTVVLAKVMAALILILAFDLGLGAMAFAVYAAVGVVVTDPFNLAGLFIGAAALHSAVFALALVATVRLARPRSATSIGLGLIFGLYGLGVVGALNDGLGALRLLSPFHYAEPAKIAGGELWGGVVVLVVVAILAIVGATLIFARKDIHA